MKKEKIFVAAVLFVLVTFSVIVAKAEEQYISTNRIPVGLEFNILFNAPKRYSVTQYTPADQPNVKFPNIEMLFDGRLSCSQPSSCYTTGGIDTNSFENSLRIRIENLPAVHTQAGAWVGWTSRYCAPKRFRISLYNGTGWTIVADYKYRDYQGYSFIQKVPHDKFTKLQLEIYKGDPNCGGKAGITELFFIHPEATRLYAGLLPSSLWEIAGGHLAIEVPSGSSGRHIEFVMKDTDTKIGFYARRYQVQTSSGRELREEVGLKFFPGSTIWKYVKQRNRLYFYKPTSFYGGEVTFGGNTEVKIRKKLNVNGDFCLDGECTNSFAGIFGKTMMILYVKGTQQGDGWVCRSYLVDDISEEGKNYVCFANPVLVTGEGSINTISYLFKKRNGNYTFETFVSFTSTEEKECRFKWTCIGDVPLTGRYVCREGGNADYPRKLSECIAVSYDPTWWNWLSTCESQMQGKSCTDRKDCCLGLGSLTCINGKCEKCYPAGHSCHSWQECCSGDCKEGRCR